MTSSRSFLYRARAAARLGAAAFMCFGFALACATDLPPDETDNARAGKTGTSTSGSAGKAGAGQAGSTSAGAPGMGDAGVADMGDAGQPGSGGLSAGGSSGGIGTGGTGGGVTGTGGAQGGSAGGTAVCGNNKLEAGEECDDGNTKNWDGCSSTCKNKCEQCEKQYCVTPTPEKEDYFLNCFTDLGSVSKPSSGNSLATAGPAMGQTKQKLCANLVACLRRTNCTSDSAGAPKGCFCGSLSASDCQDPQKTPLGPCVNEIAAAAESMSFADIGPRWEKTQYAVGMASKIVRNCDIDVCPSECLGNKAISACERCTFGQSQWQQFGGLGDAYYSCYFQPPLKCASSTGPTAACPAATCAPAADCALTTHCAAKSVADCYGPDGHGPCAAQFAAAAGSTDTATVLDRLQNGGDYASAPLVGLLEIERQDDCKATCFPDSATGSGGGSAGGATSGAGNSAGGG